MTMFLAPYTAIADIDGSPLDAGFLFFGEYGKDPELFPVEVFWDSDFTVPATQPIRTRNGYPVRNGSPTKVYLKTAQHSIVIKNRNSAFILVDFNNKGWDASFVVDGDKTQHEINNYIFKNTYYAEMEGFIADGTTDNFAVWQTLSSKLNDGDAVIFKDGEFFFSQEISIDKVVAIRGMLRSQALGTVFKFEGTSGVVRNSGYSIIEHISITGTKTSTVLDFDNRVFGTVGLKEANSSVSARSGGGMLKGVSVIGFDVNRLTTQEGTEVWAGAYRENYDVLLRSGRYGYVALDGATHEKFYGGVISANTEGGVWSSATIDTPEIPRTYNNIEFHGTTFEVNGKLITDFAGDATDMQLNIYSGGHSRVSLFGSYNELVNNYAENGGQILYFGTYQHRNARSYAKNGHIVGTGSFAPHENKFVYDGRLSSLLLGGAGVTSTDVHLGSKSVNIKSAASGLVQVYTPTILTRATKNKHIRAIKLGVKYKFSSGYTANTELMLNPIVRLTSATSGRADTSLTNRSFPTSILKGAYGEANYFEFIFYPRFSETVYLDEEGLLAGVQLQLHIKNGDSDPDFTTDNLSLDIDIINMSLFSDHEFPFTYTLPISGATSTRPALGVYDVGYRYYDTTIQRTVIWDGGAWVEEQVPIERSATAHMSSITNAINTVNKFTRFVYNSTNGKIYYPIGTAAASAWRATDGSGDITPT